MLNKRRQLIEEIGKRIPHELHSIPTKSLYTLDDTSDGNLEREENDVLLLTEDGHRIDEHGNPTNPDHHDVEMTDVDTSSSTAV